MQRIFIHCSPIVRKEGGQYGFTASISDNGQKLVVGNPTQKTHVWDPVKVQPGTARYSQVAPGTARYSLVQPGTARNSLVQPGTVSYSQVQSGTARYSQVQPGTAR